MKKWLKEDRIMDLSGNFRVDRHIDMFCIVKYSFPPRLLQHNYYLCLIIGNCL